MKENESVFNSLYDLYNDLGLPVNTLNHGAGFTIHNLRDSHFPLPYKSPPFRPNYFSFIFVKEAYGKYIIDELTFETRPGSVYFTNPGNYRIFEWDRIEDACLITFDEAFLKENLHQDVFNEFSFLLTETVHPKILNPGLFEEIERLYVQIQQEYLRKSPYQYRIIGNLFIVILLKIKEYFFSDYNPIYEGNRSSQIVKNFRRTIEQHYRDLRSGKAQTVFRVQDYADAQSLHPNYLSNVIKTKTGKAIGTWIAEKTISEAKALLQNSSVSIKEIAYMLGFTESAHFSNYFKKHTESSPVAYRRAHATV